MISQQVYEAFDLNEIIAETMLSDGLINSSFKVSRKNGDSFFLQKINTNIFTDAEALQNNYMLIQQHLAQKNSFNLPAILYTHQNKLIFKNGSEAWRCMKFIKNTYSPSTVLTPEKAFETATCFGRFTADMHHFNLNRLTTILPGFHNLCNRFNQLKAVVKNADKMLLNDSKELLGKTEKYNYLLEWYRKISADKTGFPLHIMHHDCKISNILFNTGTDELRCPVDFDTTQPGLFFSDIGDMLRTMVSNTTENHEDLKDIEVRPAFYQAVTQGYTDAMSACFTEQESANLSYAGSVLIYMQAIRFLADYLNGSIYYKVDYPNQNKHRAANQFQLLQLLERFLKR